MFYSHLFAKNMPMPPTITPLEQQSLDMVVSRLKQFVYGDRAANWHSITVGFLQSPPLCGDQTWHLDFDGTTENIFVPLTRVTDLNGTEYVTFEDDFDQLNVELLVDNFGDASVIKTKDELGLHELPPRLFDREFKKQRLNCEPYTVVHLPHWVLHRGVNNGADHDRITFYVCCSFNATFDLAPHRKALVITRDEDNKLYCVHARVCVYVCMCLCVCVCVFVCVCVLCV
jgi:hypothetical protein